MGVKFFETVKVASEEEEVMAGEFVGQGGYSLKVGDRLAYEVVWIASCSVSVITKSIDCSGGC